MAKKKVAKKQEVIEEELVEELVLEEKEVPKQVEKLIGGKISLVDINLNYRKGSFVPQEKIDLWQSMGLDISGWF